MKRVIDLSLTIREHCALCFSKEGIVAMEHLCNLHLITRDRVQFTALPLRIEGAEGSPARAIAIEG